MAANAKQVWQWATVVGTHPLTDAVKQLELRVDVPAPAFPGAHVDVAVPREQGGDLLRSYSVVAATAGGETLTLAVLRRAGSLGGSRFMHGLAAGDRLRVTQPLQSFPLRLGARSYALVAGGVGITALSAMADALLAVGADYRLVYLARSADAAAYLPALRGRHGDRLHARLSAEGGRVEMSDLVGPLDPGTELYTCGPIRLMDALRRAWLRDGREESMFRYETFGNSGWYEPESFAVHVPRLGIRTTVTADRSILETLEDAGVDIMSDCRRGECGLCEVRVLESSGEVEHRDVFYSDRQKQRGGRLCACVSRVVSAASPSGGSGAAPPQITVDFG